MLPFLMTDFLPPLAFLAGASEVVNFRFFCVYVLSYLALFVCYELGYIINDTITILHESEPTIRLSEKEAAYFYANGVLIVGVRLFLLLSCCLLLRFVLSVSVETLLFGCLATLIVYCLNNHYRNGVRYLANLLLNILKYFVPLLPFGFFSDWRAYMLLFCLFSLARFAFFCIKHIAKCSKITLDGVQCAFYLCGFIVTVFLRSALGIGTAEVSFCFLFFVYRLLVLSWALKRFKNRISV